VRISKGFWLSKSAVTIAQWRQYCRDSGTPLRAHIISPTDDYPMSGVSWNEVRGYCRFYGLALPTEAQWEYAARGPGGRTYPWGNQWDKNRCCNNDNPGPRGFTCPVGSYPNGASWCGALDMAGNLSTWCEDWYAKTYYAHSPGVDPTGPETGTERVQRGGYCWGDADECRSARRFGDDPTNDGGSGSARPCFTPVGSQN
jgi:formylglycine-generating enzyme required for sulfatase activity